MMPPKIHWYVICSTLTIAAGATLGYLIRRFSLALLNLSGGR